MNLPFFYLPVLPGPAQLTGLEGESFRHAVQVLRMKAGMKLQLTDGQGQLALAEIQSVSKKDCTLRIAELSLLPRAGTDITLAISLLKNTGRMEWFLEKAAELGISRIVPLVCDRTERQQFRRDRLMGILISAMLQSRQTWLTELHDPLNFSDFISHHPSTPGGCFFIAHCLDTGKMELSAALEAPAKPAVMLIGPEGDFTADEISLASGAGYQEVALGSTRLRTETAGVAAAVLLRLQQH